MEKITITRLNDLTREELEAYRIGVIGILADRDFAMPFSILAALRNTSPEWMPISNGMFYVVLHYLCNDIGVFRAVETSSTVDWLDDAEICGWIKFITGGASYIMFLTEGQKVVLDSVLRLDSDSPSFYVDFSNIVNEAQNAILPTTELTEIELHHTLCTRFHITPNSGSLGVDETTSRFNGATWFEEIQKKTVILAGLGGIGSYVCFLLARMQPTAIFLYDDDIVEAANMSGQLYGLGDIDNYKVDAMKDMIENYAGYNSVFAIREKFTSSSEAADIMICGFDNMEARNIYFHAWAAHVRRKETTEEKSHCLFIDGRLSAEYLQVYCISGDDESAILKYEETALFSDEEADETVCSYKQTTYMANMIGSFIVNLFTNFVANEVAGAPIRELPYFTSYDGNSMQLKIE